MAFESWIELEFKSTTESKPALRTPHHYAQFALSPGKESPCIFSKFNPLDIYIPLIRTLSRAPSVSVLTGFDCIRCFIYLFNYLSFIPSFIFSLVEEEELREPYQINIKAKNEPAPGSTSSLRHPSPIRPHPTMPRCQHLIFWLSNSINLRSEILFILQLSNQLTDRLRTNNIKVLAEVRLQANDPKRAIRTIKVTVLVWPSLRTKCLSFVSSANSWKRSTKKKPRSFHLPQVMDQLLLSSLSLSQECVVCSLSQPKGVRVTHLSLIAKQPVKFVFS